MQDKNAIQKQNINALKFLRFKPWSGRDILLAEEEHIIQKEIEGI